MKRALYIIILIITLCFTTSCVQNRGFIGDLFGQWRLEQIEYDNNSLECDTIFFAFQTNIIQVRNIRYFPHYEHMTFTGLYSRQDNLLKVDFYNHNGNIEDANSEEEKAAMLRDLKILYIDELSPIFTVEKLNYNEMILEYNELRYIFTKLN